MLALAFLPLSVLKPILCKRIANEIPQPLRVIATGGDAELLFHGINRIEIVDHDLTLEGILRIGLLNFENFLKMCLEPLNTFEHLDRPEVGKSMSSKGSASLKLMVPTRRWFDIKSMVFSSRVKMFASSPYWF